MRLAILLLSFAAFCYASDVQPDAGYTSLKDVFAQQKAEEKALIDKHNSTIISFIKKIDLEPIAELKLGQDPKVSDVQKNNSIKKFNNNLSEIKSYLNGNETDFGKVYYILGIIGVNASMGVNGEWVEQYNKFKGKKFPNISKDETTAPDAAIAEKKKPKITATLANGTKVE